jgi:hypothetical protein
VSVTPGASKSITVSGGGIVTISWAAQ